MNYFITAIGTDSGKTLVSAIFCEALQADYWKPIQAGLPRDADTVSGLISNTLTKIHAEQHILKTPASPHAAAKIDGVEINKNGFTLPKTNQPLVIEGAGGALVPINEKDFVIDIASQFSCEIILVSNLYLGSINHTLLTAEALTHRKLKVKGIVFNGPDNPASKSIILHHTKYPVLLDIQQEKEINKKVVKHYAEILKKNLQ